MSRRQERRAVGSDAPSGATPVGSNARRKQRAVGSDAPEGAARLDLRVVIVRQWPILDVRHTKIDHW
ncbi:hypothetical protein SAMN02745244_03243, partial [Tessaracoccus bendigoensis DSM 12906]